MADFAERDSRKSAYCRRVPSEPEAVQVRLLGSVDIVVGGEARPLPGLRRKALLAALALERGRIVSADRLIDIVWNDEAPAGRVAATPSCRGRPAM
jgi:DNA-binding response OmpR family regulator